MSSSSKAPNDPVRPADKPGVGQPAGQPASASTSGRRKAPDNMLPARKRRSFLGERLLMRVIATSGVVAIGVAIAAIMASSNAQGWVIGLVVAIVSVVLSAALWSSRQL